MNRTLVSTRENCLGLLLFAILLATGLGAQAATISRSFFSSPATSVRTFITSHPRLVTRAAGMSAALVGGYLLYKGWKMYAWLKTRDFLPIKSEIAFLVELPNGSLVVGEWSGSYLSVWDTTKYSLIKRVHMGDMMSGSDLQIVVLSEDTIVLRSKYEHARVVVRVDLNLSEGQAVCQTLDKPVDMSSKKQEEISWITKGQTRQLLCKTKQGHCYQLMRHPNTGAHSWVEYSYAKGETVSMPADALKEDSRLEVKLSNGRTARVVRKSWFWNPGVEIVGKAS